MASTNELNTICQQAMQHLKDASAYSQVEIFEKLANVGYPVTKTVFHYIISGKGASPKFLKRAAEGMQAILKNELGMEWVNAQFVRTAGEGFQPEIVPNAKDAASKKGFRLHEQGRLSVADKVAFFKDARQEVIEFGVTLSKFASNLSSGSREEFRNHVEALLERGVHFKCYLLKPDCNEARLYFNDREAVHSDEAHYKRKIETATDSLRSIQAEFAQAGYLGKFEVFTYEHVPYGYFMAVDGGTEHCKMLVSHYLFGVKRGDAPVLEFSRKNNVRLYLTYWQSLAALMKNAKRIIPACR